MLRAMILAATGAVLVSAALPGGGPAAAPSAAAATAVGSGPASTHAPAGRAALVRAGWRWPLDPAPAVVRPFHAPPTPWSAGHRGVDLRALVGQPVLAAAAGTVTFAGSVAGRGVVVLTHAGGLRTSYEPVTALAAVGTVAAPGTRIAVVAGTAGHCAPSSCLHWGLRRGDLYLDPLAFLSVGPPVLKPLLG